MHHTQTFANRKMCAKQLAVLLVFVQHTLAQTYIFQPVVAQ